jgi:flagellar biosynthesis/type III secretory pathway chaperone
MTIPEPVLQLLDTQSEHLSSLESLLADELNALTKRQLDEFQSILSKKSHLLNNLQETDQQLTQLLSSQFPDYQTHEAFIRRRKEIDGQLNKVKEMNEVNGKVIQSNQTTLLKFKELLFASKGRKAMTYGADGKSHRGPSDEVMKA